MEVHATTVYDEKTRDALFKQTLKNRKTILIFAFLLAFELLVLDIYGSLKFDKPVVETLSTLVGILIFTLLILVYLPYRFKKQNESIPISVEHYTFFDLKLYINSKSSLSSTDAYINYLSISKVIEQENYVFIYIFRNRVLIIDKSTITGGTVNDIRNAIISCIGIKNYKY